MFFFFNKPTSLFITKKIIQIKNHTLSCEECTAKKDFPYVLNIFPNPLTA